AEQLVSKHLPESRRKREYDYDFDRLQKGIICGTCGCFMKPVYAKLVCLNCDLHEDIDVGIIRSVEELQRLFPNLKITLNTVQEWLGVIDSRKQIRRVLKEHLKLIRHGRYSFYTFDD